MLIYKITNDVNNKIYIGQTTHSLENRIKQHYNSYVSGVNTHLYNAMRKYGWDKFHFTQIDSASSQEELDRLEDMYIVQYDSIKNGYNMIRGGRANPMDSAEVKRKHDAIMRSADVRNRIRATVLKQCENGRSEEYRRKMSESKKALYASARGDEAKNKFRASFHFSESHYKAVNEAKYKAVYCIDAENNVVERFNCVKDAARWWYDHGYIVKDINQLCDRIKESSRKDKYIKGLKWVYCV